MVKPGGTANPARLMLASAWPLPPTVSRPAVFAVNGTIWWLLNVESLMNHSGTDYRRLNLNREPGVPQQRRDACILL